MFMHPAFASAHALHIARHSPSTRRVSAAKCPCMSHAASDVSRRDLLLSTAAVAIATTVTLVPNLPAPAAAAAAAAPTYIKDDSGVLYYDIKLGSGAGPIDGDFVIVDYLAFLSSGKIFDNRKGFVFQVGQRQVIPGLEAAIVSMRPGGQRRVVVPPPLAYGDKGVCLPDKDECLVPPGERLGYDVTLQRVAIPPT